MKSRIGIVEVSLVLVCSILVSACGGGSSDSGGAQNDVTSCITTQRNPIAGGASQTTITNNCDFAVNLGRGIVSIDTVVTLQPGDTDTTFVVGGLIACRPPSQPFDRDDSTGRDFACTD